MMTFQPPSGFVPPPGGGATSDLDANARPLSATWHATVAKVLGWIGCSVFGLGLGRLFGFTSIAGGAASIVLGIGAVAGIVALAKKRCTPCTAPVLDVRPRRAQSCVRGRTVSPQQASLPRAPPSGR
jgi:hypothetical protein